MGQKTFLASLVTLLFMGGFVLNTLGGLQIRSYTGFWGKAGGILVLVLGIVLAVVGAAAAGVCPNASISRVTRGRRPNRAPSSQRLPSKRAPAPHTGRRIEAARIASA